MCNATEIGFIPQKQEVARFSFLNEKLPKKKKISKYRGKKKIEHAKVF